MPREILIGTGFWADAKTFDDRLSFYYQVWLPNTEKHGRVFVANNSQVCWSFSQPSVAVGDLGYTGGDNIIRGNRIMGWSMSWILPALIAYSENCDYIYKEQDCLAFGDWLPVVRGDSNGFRCGRYSRMDAEQSLFFLERDFIPDFIAAYLSIQQSDLDVLPETKGPAAAKLCRVTNHFYDMPFGRERPLTIYTDRPWYAQRFSPEELDQVRKAGLI